MKTKAPRTAAVTALIVAVINQSTGAAFFAPPAPPPHLRLPPSAHMPAALRMPPAAAKTPAPKARVKATSHYRDDLRSVAAFLARQADEYLDNRRKDLNHIKEGLPDLAAAARELLPGPQDPFFALQAEALRQAHPAAPAPQAPVPAPKIDRTVPPAAAQSPLPAEPQAEPAPVRELTIVMPRLPAPAEPEAAPAAPPAEPEAAPSPTPTRRVILYPKFHKTKLAVNFKLADFSSRRRREERGVLPRFEGRQLAGKGVNVRITYLNPAAFARATTRGLALLDSSRLESPDESVAEDHQGVYPVYYQRQVMRYEIEIENTTPGTLKNLRVEAWQESYRKDGQAGHRLQDSEASFSVAELKPGQKTRVVGTYRIGADWARHGSLDQTHVVVREAVSGGRTLADIPQAGIFDPPPDE